MRMSNALVAVSANGEGVTPVPIPNTEAKPFSVDGTAALAVGE